MPSPSQKPRVSVVMAARNAEAFIDPAVASILDQTFEDFEFLAYDDGSSDGTLARLTQWAARDGRLRVLRRPAEGLTVRLQEGVEAARGLYLARMDADDVAHPERLARQVAHLDRHPEIVALGCDVRWVDPDRRPIRPGGVPTGHAEIEAALLSGAGEALPHPAVVFRREAVVRVGGYRPVFSAAQDLDLYLRLARVGRLANLPDVLLDYRQHLGKVSVARAEEQARCVSAILDEERSRRGWADGAPTFQAEAAAEASPPDFFRLWAEWAIDARELATARYYARRVLAARPGHWRSWQLYVRAWAGLRLSTAKRVVGLLGRAPAAARAGGAHAGAPADG